MKKTLSILLSLAMIISSIAGIDIIANAATNYESEPNYGYTPYGYVTNDIRLNSSISGYNDTEEDEDWFMFELNESKKVTLSFAHEKSDSGKWLVYVYRVIDSSSQEYFDTVTDVYADGGTYTFSKHDYPKGIYRIKVAPRYYYGYPIGVEYTISLTEYINKPSSLKISSRGVYSLKLSWGKVGNVTGYQVQRKVGDKYKHIAYTSNNYYTVKDLKSATNYALRVRAYKTIDGKKYFSVWRNLTTPTKPAKVSIKTPSTNSKHQIIVKWKALSRGSGYQVQFSKKKNFSSVIATKTVSGKTKTSYTGKKFTKGRTYYVRVRGYKTVDGTKYYGAWSNVKSIKCK